MKKINRDDCIYFQFEYSFENEYDEEPDVIGCYCYNFNRVVNNAECEKCKFYSPEIKDDLPF